MAAACDPDVLSECITALHQLGVFAATDAIEAEPAFKAHQLAQVFAKADARREIVPWLTPASIWSRSCGL